MAAPYALDAEERERLILEYLPKVRWIAAGIHERLSAGTLEEDLVSTGILGLINAIDNFDPSRNVALWTYAEYKIRGAMLDSIRGLDGIAAHKRKHLKLVQEAIARVEQRVGRSAVEEEIAAELGMTTEQYQQVLMDLRGITVDSLDAPLPGADSKGSEASLARFVSDERAEDPLQILERTQMESLVAKGIDSLPETERVILQLYFVEELTLMEIGRVVNLHYSRVSQLKSQAVLRLRSFLQRRAEAR